MYTNIRHLGSDQIIYDLVLLHPPTVYDFRKEMLFTGPISDVVPSSPVFEMYPVGLTSIGDYLERYGLKVKIVNIANRMLLNPNFDVEKKLRKLKQRHLVLTSTGFLMRMEVWN